MENSRNFLQTESGAISIFWNKVGKTEEVKIIGRFGLGTYNNGRKNFGKIIISSLVNTFSKHPTHLESIPGYCRTSELN